MAKKYIRINFEDAPSAATPLDKNTLNRMDAAIDDIDTWRDGLIVDNAASALPEKAWSANQGKIITDKFNTLNESLFSAGNQNIISDVLILKLNNLDNKRYGVLLEQSLNCPPNLQVGIREPVEKYDNNSILVTVTECYPEYGRVWNNMYNQSTGIWMGWKSLSESLASFYKVHNNVLTDADFAVSPGTYTFDPNTANAESGYGIINVDVGLSGMWIFQTKRNTDGNIRYREKINEEPWKPWRS